MKTDFEPKGVIDTCAVRESLNGKQVTDEEWLALFPNEACQTCPSAGCLWSMKTIERLDALFANPPQKRRKRWQQHAKIEC